MVRLSWQANGRFFVQALASRPFRSHNFTGRSGCLRGPIALELAKDVVDHRIIGCYVRLLQNSAGPSINFASALHAARNLAAVR